MKSSLELQLPRSGSSFLLLPLLVATAVPVLFRAAAAPPPLSGSKTSGSLLVVSDIFCFCVSFLSFRLTASAEEIAVLYRLDRGGTRDGLNQPLVSCVLGTALVAHNKHVPANEKFFRDVLCEYSCVGV